MEFPYAPPHVLPLPSTAPARVVRLLPLGIHSFSRPHQGLLPQLILRTHFEKHSGDHSISDRCDSSPYPQVLAQRLAQSGCSKHFALLNKQTDPLDETHICRRDVSTWKLGNLSETQASQGPISNVTPVPRVSQAATSNGSGWPSCLGGGQDCWLAKERPLLPTFPSPLSEPTPKIQPPERGVS